MIYIYMTIINMIYITIIYNIYLYSHYIYVYTISIPYKEIIYIIYTNNINIQNRIYNKNRYK